jgi:hypothetical protein
MALCAEAFTAEQKQQNLRGLTVHDSSLAAGTRRSSPPRSATPSSRTDCQPPGRAPERRRPASENTVP